MVTQLDLNRLEDAISDMPVTDVVKALTAEFNVDGLNHIMDMLEDFIQKGDV